MGGGITGFFKLEPKPAAGRRVQEDNLLSIVERSLQGTQGSVPFPEGALYFFRGLHMSLGWNC